MSTSLNDYQISTGINVALPPGATVARAILALTWRKSVDSSGGLNYLDGASSISLKGPEDGAVYTPGISVPDQSVQTLASSVEPGTTIYGDNSLDLKDIVLVDGLYLVQWVNAKMQGNNLSFYDIQPHLFVEFF